MALANRAGEHIIWGSLIVALLLTAFPLPEWLAPWRPDWLTMALCYWVFQAPGHVGIARGWILGLIVDVLTASVLGMHALSLSTVAYGAQSFYRRVRAFSVWQTGLIVLVLVLAQLLICLMVERVISGTVHIDYSYWFPALSSALTWPWLVIAMRRVSERFKLR